MSASRLGAMFLVVLVMLASPALAQRPLEHLSPREQDIVRVAQAIEARSAVFVKIAGRRVLALTGGAQEEKDAERYGPLPEGSQAELLDNYKRVLEEFMDKLDDFYERKGSSPEMGKAMKQAVAGLEAQLKTLETQRDRLQGEAALHAYRRAVETAQTLLDGIRPLIPADEKQ